VVDKKVRLDFISFPSHSDAIAIDCTVGRQQFRVTKMLEVLSFYQNLLIIIYPR
jgi:hypothetical protein